MKESKDGEKNKKFTSAIKNKMFKGYEKVRNKMHTNFCLDDNIFQTFSYDKVVSNLSPNKLKNEYSNTYERINQNSKEFQYNFDNFNNINIKNFSKTKKDDYNNILNKLFFTTSHIIKNQKYLRNKKQKVIHTNYDIIEHANKLDEKNKIINKLFPDINEINKFSNLPFFSLIKVRNPYKMKANMNNKREINKKFPQEEFLYKISHNNNDDEEKINNNFIKNKGIKKGRTTKYFHGVNKFCINNKVSETNYYLDDDINKQKKLKLQLDIANLTKGGEKIPQISNKEKHIKVLQNNINNIKLIPNQLVNDLEDGVFKFIDEEFDNIYNKEEADKTDKKNEEYKINLPASLNSDAADNNNNKSTNTNIINLSNNFQFNNINNYKLMKVNNNQKSTKYNSYNNNSVNYTSSGFKKPQQYPINFYSTQQLKKKEHFNKTCKNTFDERNRNKKKGYNSERNTKKQLFDENQENLKELQRKKITTNGTAYKKECKIRDIILGNKLKCEFSPVDIKRILNGLKPWVDIKLDEEINVDIGNINDNKIDVNKLK